MKNGFYGLAILGAIFMGITAMAEEPTYEVFRLEQPRPFDDQYQIDVQKFKQDISAVLKRLSVRAPDEIIKTINDIRIQIGNKGRAEAFTTGQTIYLDIAILDLLDHSALEAGISDVKSDAIHNMEFVLAYSVALKSDKELHGVDPYNHARLSEAQWKTLWQDVMTFRTIYYENCLAFIIAHELGHVQLRHKGTLEQEFPSEAAKNRNPDSWRQRRRKMELEADAFAANLTLNAFYQPANIIPWFSLIGARRHYYGTSPEYPEPGQREAMIRKVYQDWVDKGLMPNDAVPRLDPLPPDMDVTKVDPIIFIKRFQELRVFRRNYLRSLDEQLTDLLNQGNTLDDSLAAVITLTMQYQEIMESRCEKPELLRQIVQEIETAKQGGDVIDTKKIRGLIMDACKNKRRQKYLLQWIDVSEPDWESLSSTAELLTNQRTDTWMEFDWKYFLSNSIYRWNPDIFLPYKKKVNDMLGMHIDLKPYKIGEPLRKIPISGPKMLEFVKDWNGSYLTK